MINKCQFNIPHIKVLDTNILSLYYISTSSINQLRNKVYIYMYVCVCMYVYVYTHTHTHPLTLAVLSGLTIKTHRRLELGYQSSKESEFVLTHQIF